MLKTELSNVHKVDVSQEPQITQHFGVMGTPATVVVENRKIVQYILGAKSESFLRKIIMTIKELLSCLMRFVKLSGKNMI